MIAHSGSTSGTTNRILVIGTGTDSTDNIDDSGTATGTCYSNKSFCRAMVSLSVLVTSLNYSTYEIKKLASLLKEIKKIAHSSTTRAPYVPKVKLIFHFPIPRSIYNARMLFPKSGYLPWRIRKKKKDM